MTLTPVEVETRLDTYAELRGMGENQEACATRLRISLSGLEQFLYRHRDDPRARTGYAGQTVYRGARFHRNAIPQPPTGGACVGLADVYDSASFILARKGRPSYRHPDVARALLICRDCPVRDACLAWALDVGDRYSILGGTTPADRERLRKASA